MKNYKSLKEKLSEKCRILKEPENNQRGSKEMRLSLTLIPKDLKQEKLLMLDIISPAVTSLYVDGMTNARKNTRSVVTAATETIVRAKMITTITNSNSSCSQRTWNGRYVRCYRQH